ncbi:Origin recognition complex subunit 6 [Phytophthora citrophthora]|uniref:Origin recognition complex subunit 6 n=1 Tax=Phytophthora citrophthora TaxID=4793 RepID=A0AAD9GRW5_9STRA|nr:Origin recognition complex subunit 6 [Phytophthora citrophthora]
MVSISNMDVKTIADRYGGLPARVVARAQENWRMTSAKKSTGLDPFAGPVACIVVAARALEETVDKKRLAKCAGANIRLVEPTVRKVVDAVGVSTVIKTSPAALCIKFGCEALTDIVHRVLDEYSAYLAQVAAANKRKRSKHPLGPIVSTMNVKDPMFVAACLFAASKQAKMNVNQAKLLEAVCGNAKAFDAVVSSIESQCKASLSGAIMDRKKRRALAGERASMKLTEEHRLEQREEEERVKRQKMSQMASPLKTAAQQRVLQKLLAARTGVATAQSPGEARKSVMAAAPEEYAEWRANALEFMRNKKQQEKTAKAGEDQLTVAT